MEAADKVIAVSFYTQKIIIERYGISPDKVVTVHNAVLPRDKPFGKFEDVFPEKIVTFLGRITMQKGPDYFIEAAYKVLQRDKNVRFVMAGSGDMLWKMVKRVAELRMSSRFHFTGFLQGDDVDKMYAMSDVYVMPSVSEPFGITPLEAMRANVPVIVSKQSGVSEVLHHAIKIDFWDIDAMADAIHSFLNYQAITRIFAKAGKEEVENLKWSVAARKVKMVYEKVVLG
jgi:glycosyltransferase involved in cell wall biosynthesis